MPTLTGDIDGWGATLTVVIMQTHQRILALRKAGKRHAPPMTGIGLIDTGASGSAIDGRFVRMLDLDCRGSISIHTPSSGLDLDVRDQYDVSISLGGDTGSPLEVTTPVICCDLWDRGGIHALIGRDILSRCILTFDGPSNRFTLGW